MGKFLKKNWFVVLISVVFVAFISYYIYDTNKGKLKGKQVNGEDVVFEIDGQDTVASAFYDELYKSNGNNSLLTLFSQTVADAAVSTTSEMKDQAKEQAKSITANYATQYGDSYQTQLASDLEGTGYTDLEEYLIARQKVNQVTADYAKKNFNDLQIRQISYILIKYDDSNNPTAEPTEAEQKKMDDVDKLLKKDNDFAAAAQEYSEDTSTASTGGNLGVIDKNASSLDSAFLEASLSLNEGEVSEWVRSDSFGYFKIMCTAATQETLEANNTDTDPYVALVQNYDTTLANKAIWEKAEELGIDFHGNEDVEKAIKTAYGVADTTTDKTKSEEAEEEKAEEETEPESEEAQTEESTESE